MAISIKKLKRRVDYIASELSQLTSLTQRMFSAEQRLNVIDQIFRGGIKGYEGLLFRVTQLEQLIQMKDHIKPVTKKQMKEIRKLLKKEWMK